MTPRWMIYALGGGMGHLTRALSLARQAARSGVSVCVLSNSRFAPAIADPTGDRRLRQLVPLEAGIELVALPSDGDKTDVRSAVHRVFHGAEPPDVLVVDTFPRGLAGELVERLRSISSFKVFVHRDLNPEYVAWADLSSFVSSYDLVLVPGEDAPLAHLPHARRTAPWLICDEDELLPAAAARAALGVAADDGHAVIIVMGSGKPDEALAAAHATHCLARRLAGQASVRFVSCDESALAVAGELGCSPWPFLAVLRGVDLLIGAGGYNTVHEARAQSTRLIAIAQPRLYDRQAYRLLPHERAESWEQAVDLAVAQHNGTAPNPGPPRAAYSNGAAEACRMIAARLMDRSFA